MAEYIEIIKGAPSDDMMKKILSQWYGVSKPKWKPWLDAVVLIFFTSASILLMYTGQTTYAWIAIAGFVMSCIALFGYIPYLVNMALKVSKLSPSYNKKKTYRFYPDKFQFGYEGSEIVEGPLNAFTSVHLTQDALLFLGGKRLALWIVKSDLTPEELATLLAYLENNGVPVK